MPIRPRVLRVLLVIAALGALQLPGAVQADDSLCAEGDIEVAPFNIEPLAGGGALHQFQVGEWVVDFPVAPLGFRPELATPEMLEALRISPSTYRTGPARRLAGLGFVVR